MKIILKDKSEYLRYIFESKINKNGLIYPIAMKVKKYIFK
jgi:hypothetical protein